MPNGGFQLAGAWGFRPFENDSALDWLAGKIQKPMAKVIEGRLKMKPTGRHDYDKIVAAAALLDHLTFRRPPEGVQMSPPGAEKRWHPGGYETVGILHLNYEAETSRLWSLAVNALEAILDDGAWIASWARPNEKIHEMNELINSLQSKEDQEDPE